MRNQSKIQNPKSKILRGFTLIELVVVMIIISILLTFILTAAMDAARSADQSATQALIAKLESALNDRLDALLQEQPNPSPGHQIIAWSYHPYNTGFTEFDQNKPITNRAYVIAMFDFIK